MSSQPPNEPIPAKEASKGPSDRQTILFMVVLSFICALILSVLASALAEPKEIAKDFDRSKQMMMAAKILGYDGRFLALDQEGNTVPAKYVSGGFLTPDPTAPLATNNELLEVYKKRLLPRLLDKEGKLHTFEELQLNENQYLSDHKKTGYYKQPYKLLYLIAPNEKSENTDLEPIGYVIPVNGFGLWDAIYGYIALKPDGNTVIGITWYDQKETPGLGANISESYWQNLFPGKVIFQESVGGKTDFQSAPLGITVVKGKVSEVLGSSPKAKSAVDGMAGATLTGNGVTEAYRSVLTAYRPFLIKLHAETEKNQAK